MSTDQSLPNVRLPQGFDDGDASGGTLLTVTGSGFAPGVTVKVGGVTLSQIVRLDSATVQGFTRARPAGTVAVAVINPGAAAAVLPGAFTYLPTASDPGLTVSASGPVGPATRSTWCSEAAPAPGDFPVPARRRKGLNPWTIAPARARRGAASEDGICYDA